MYQMEPIGVVVPRHADDVQAVLEVANRRRRRVLPRGGGTSLTGQTVNHAVVLDFSRHMNRVLEVNAEELWARVQPGLVQDELNAHVRPAGPAVRARHLDLEPRHHRRHARQQLGRLALHRLRAHRRARDRDDRAPGRRQPGGLREVTPEQFEAKMPPAGLEGQIYREVAPDPDQYAAEIRARYPKHWRRVCGYNLDELVKDRPLNMARLSWARRARCSPWSRRRCAWCGGPK